MRKHVLGGKEGVSAVLSSSDSLNFQCGNVAMLWVHQLQHGLSVWVSFSGTEALSEMF